MPDPDVLDLSAHFRLFQAAAPRRINLAAHSHHDWPDVTRAAQIEAWDDAAAQAGEKWGIVFGQMLPEIAAGIARHLHLPDPATLAFAPNTHEFLRRIVSAFDPRAPLSVLASDAEFHTFRRQMARLAEDGLVRLAQVPAEPFATFADRFCAAARAAPPDLAFASQVFFTSGAAAGSLQAIAAAMPARTVLAIDGYHGWMAVPTDLSAIADRAFYLSGGYKYAMAGEGACFLHAPPGLLERPRDTGWFADFGALAAPQGLSVGYPAGGARFLGATFDPVGLYRQRAVLRWMAGLGLEVSAVHAHARALMARFLAGLARIGRARLAPEMLITPLGGTPGHGNFLTFRTAEAGAIAAALARVEVHTDHRDDRLRIGFGLSLTQAALDEALSRIDRALAG